MALAAILITIIILLTTVGRTVTHRFVDKRHLEGHEELISAMLGVVGTLFSVLIGLLVANAIDNYYDIRGVVSNEANAVADVFRLARGLQADDRLRIRNLCRKYVDEVIESEWELMRKREMSDKAWEVYTELWEASVAINPVNDRQNNLQQVLLNSMQQLGENRRIRSIACAQSVSILLWLAIAFGAIITVVFTNLFTSRLGRLHTLMTALIGVSLGLNIWLLADYSAPFSGDLRLHPDLFIELRDVLFKTPDTPSRFIHDAAPGAPDDAR